MQNLTLENVMVPFFFCLFALQIPPTLTRLFVRLNIKTRSTLRFGERAKIPCANPTILLLARHALRCALRIDGNARRLSYLGGEYIRYLRLSKLYRARRRAREREIIETFRGFARSSSFPPPSSFALTGFARF